MIAYAVYILRVLGLVLAGLTISAVASVAVFFLVFYSPVLLGQPEDSMIGWGWITTLPATGLGGIAGIAALLFLTGKFIAWRLFALPPTPLDHGQWLLTCAFIAVPLVLSGLAAFPSVRDFGVDLTEGYRRRWTEDVQLADGSVVTVKRFVRIRKVGASWGGSVYGLERKSSMAFTGSLAHLPEWDFPLMALVLYEDKSHGEWTIVATSQSCAVIAERAEPRLLFLANRPPTNYFEFRARSGRWIQVPVSSQSLGLRTNLLTWYESNKSKYVHVSEKEGYWRSREAYTWKPYLNILEIHERELRCGPTNHTRAIRESEDEVLESMEREGATSQQRQQVEELLASTRLLHVRGKQRAQWKPDTDPGTVQILGGLGSSFINREPGVSTDGQVIYIGEGRALMDDESWLLRESYAQRLRAAGLGAFAPRQMKPVVP